MTGHNYTKPGRVEVLKRYERDTWNVWTKHFLACRRCMIARSRQRMATDGCLEGQAAWDEWSIAAKRHGDALDHLHDRSHKSLKDAGA